MREWQQDLVMYKITPAPPKMEIQEYIELYCKEKDEKYFLWFLHYYENTLNTKVMGWVQNYAMPGHFQDMKQAFIIGMWKALQEYDLSRDIPFVKFKENTAKCEIHEYIRKMRRGFTVQSFDEDLRLRKAMRLFYENEEKTDDETMEKIAEEIGVTREKAEEIIRSGLQNTQLQGLSWSEGMVVYTTPFEHNAILRTLKYLENEHGIVIKELTPKDFIYDISEIKQTFLQNIPNVVVHCAPRAHEFLKTAPNGTVRFSLSYFTNDKDFEKLEEILSYIEENS